ncbi:MAG: deoxynucleoside kinase [Chloroflexales bacterium]|nr:deoxynucleoside kinase [Chloroflexales bacterium]
MSRGHHIVIAGNIGVGKSTLVGLLAERCGWTPVYELEGAHPYLADYYADPRRWGFHSQIWFLAARFTQHQRIAALTGTVVQDRSLYEDAAVFAASLHAQGLLSDRDDATYRQLYGAIVRELRPPDLVVYLQASVPTLLRRIAGRARPAERAIQPAYLASLERHYAAWIATWTACPVLSIDTEGLELSQDLAAQTTVIGRLTASLSPQCSLP